MADLPSILGGMAQGFVDLGKSAVDMFGTGGAAIGDLIESARTGKVTTKNQDDFRKWLYQTDDTKDAAAKGLGTALNGVQTSLDYIPGVNVLTHNPLGNAAQGALGGLADEFKTYGADYDLGRAGQRAAISGAAAAASGSLADALKGSSNALLSSNAVQGLARGATSGAISAGGYAAIDGGDVLEAAKQGAGMGALIGGATGAFQDFKPARTYDVALTDDERQARLANIDDQLSRLDTSTPEGGARYSELMSAQDNYLPKPRMMDNTGQAVPQELVERLANTSPLVRDENGNLMRFYHGTPDGSFDTFRDGSYFTPDRTYADIYQNPQASSISYGKQAVNPTTFETYLDIRKPFDISDPEARRVYIDEYIKGGNAMGINPYQDNYDDIKNIDWTEVENLSEFLRDGKYGYDALIADEGGVFDSAGNVVPRGKSYIPFSGDQVVTLKKNSGISPETTKKLEKILSASEDAVNNPRYLTDENGNPRTFYHGSPNKNITEFDINQAGKNTSSGEHALYFTDSPEVADEFSYERLPSDSMFVDNRGAKGRVYPVNLAMDNPLDLSNLSDKQIEELWQYASPLGKLDGKEKFIKNMKAFRDYGNDQLIKTNLDLDKLAGSQYDGFTARMYPNQDNQAREYAVFDNSKVKMLEDVLANDDMAANSAKLTSDTRYSKAAPGQRLEKTLSNGDAEINRVGSANVAPVDPTTLPDSLKAVQDYLDEGNYIKDIENFAGKPYPKLTNQDYLDYAISLKNPKDKAFYESIIKDMVDDGTTTYEKYAASTARNNRLNKLRMGSYDDINPKELASYIANHRQALSNGAIKDVDAELSDRLGIGRSNTLMMDNNLPPDALGVYDPTKTAISIDTRVPEENAINTLAHERLHSFQTEGDFKRYDKRVTDAYEELSKDLNKYLKTPEETAKRYAFDADYWGNEREQQSRMLQQYLENKGFTRGGLQKSNIGEWGNEINPAFDKFFDKLRDLSKRGVALPALAALFGGGAYMASQENDKEKEVK